MASPEHPFPNAIPPRHPLPSGFQLRPDARATTLPVTPVIPPTVASGDVITSLHENLTVAALGDLWTNEQWLAAQSVSDPTSAKGDLLARDASALARLAVGTAGQVLTVDAAAPLGVKWAAPAGAVASVFGRTGVVVSAAGDYTAAQVTNAVSTIGSYADPVWITSLAYAKITGAPAAGVPASRQVIAGSGLAGGGALTADVTLTAPVMGPSGASHKAGIVPDPGATVGATRYLREDSTWAIPAGAGGGLTDPTTTLGDLIVRGAAAPTRLGVGTNGQALLADSAAPLGVKWGTVAAGGGSQTPWTSDINAANFNLNRVQGIGIGALQDAAANFGVFISHASIFDGFKQINSSSAGWAGFSLQNDLGHLFAFRVYGSGRTPSDVAALESSIPMAFFTGAVERMRITTAGLVGIGRTPTTYPLEVGGDVNVTGVYRVNGVAISTSQTPWTQNVDAAGFSLSNLGAAFSMNTVAGYQWYVGGVSAIGPWQVARRKSSDATWAYPFTITEAGLVGIATAGPTAELEVAGSVRIAGSLAVPGSFYGRLIVHGGTMPVIAGNNHAMGGYMVFCGNQAALNSRVYAVTTGNDWSSVAMGLTFDVDGSIGAGGQLWFWGGKVGIGTPAPTAALHVLGLATYASDAAAGSAGLTTGAFYKDSGGVLHVKL